MATPNPGPPGLALTTLQAYLDDKKWLFFEKGLMTIWGELYLLSQNSNNPQLSMLGPIDGRYSYRSAAGTVIRQPPTYSRLGSPGMSPLTPP